MKKTVFCLTIIDLGEKGCTWARRGAPGREGVAHSSALPRPPLPTRHPPATLPPRPCHPCLTPNPPVTFAHSRWPPSPHFLTESRGVFFANLIGVGVSAGVAAAMASGDEAPPGNETLQSSPAFSRSLSDAMLDMVRNPALDAMHELGMVDDDVCSSKSRWRLISATNRGTQTQTRTHTQTQTHAHTLTHLGHEQRKHAPTAGGH